VTSCCTREAIRIKLELALKQRATLDQWEKSSAEQLDLKTPSQLGCEHCKVTLFSTNLNLMEPCGNRVIIINNKVALRSL
jgi:hypothetical protein